MNSAATDGIGLTYTADSYAAPYLANGQLQRVLADWCPADGRFPRRCGR